MTIKKTLQKLAQLTDIESCSFVKKAVYNDYLKLKNSINDQDLKNELIKKYKLT